MRTICVCLLLLGCVGVAQADFWGTADKLITGGQRIKDEVTPPPSADIPRPAADTDQGAVPSSGEDRHYIQPDDYFIQRHGMDDHTWIWVELAKMTTTPSSATKHEAQFMKIRDGKSYWTSHYWQSRVASPNELKLGMLVIAFNDQRRNDIYAPPTSKSQARGGNWFMARITDMSDLYKGYLTVSGNYKVSPGNLRVLIAR